MIVGSLLRQLREARHMSQGEIEKRAGLLRCYISRLENRHTVPLIETLEKMTRALAVPLYKLFYDGNTALKVPNLSKKGIASESAWGSAVADERPLTRFRRHLSRMNESDQRLHLSLVQKMAARASRWRRSKT